MPIPNYFAQDMVGTYWAFALTVLFGVAPGFVIGYLANLLAFRTRDRLLQLCLSIVLSAAIMPGIVYLAARAASMSLVWGMYAAAWVGFGAVLMIGRWRSNDVPPIDRLLAAVFGTAVLVWLAVDPLYLVDWQIGANLYRGAPTFDYIKHTFVTDAVTRTGMPPVNPVYHPGEPQYLNYYYYVYTITSLVDQLGGSLITPRTASFGMALWSGVVVMSLVVVGASFLELSGRHSVAKRSAAAVVLLAVSGLAILPTIVVTVTRSFASGYLTCLTSTIQLNDWGAVAPWFNQLTWVPQHVMGFVAGVTGIILYRAACREPDTLRAVLVSILAGLAVMSAGGLSIWAALPIPLFFLIWGAIALKNGWLNEVRNTAIMGAVAFVLSLPFIADLMSGAEPARFPLAFDIRYSRSLHEFFGAAEGVAGPYWLTGLHLLLLPILTLLEYGYVALVAAAVWVRRRREGASISRDEQFLIVVTLTVLALTMFFRSSLRDNDLGWRAGMYVQFIALIWSVDLTIDLYGSWRRRAPFAFGRGVQLWLSAALLVGLLNTGYEIVIPRVHPILEARWNADYSGVRRLYMLRRGYEWIGENTDRSAVIQQRVPDWPNDDTITALHANRQIAVMDSVHVTLFLVSSQRYLASAAEIDPIFAEPVGLDSVRTIAARYGIDYLGVKRDDLAWSDSTGWTSHVSPVFANAEIRWYNLVN